MKRRVSLNKLWLLFNTIQNRQSVIRPSSSLVSNNVLFPGKAVTILSAVIL